jgi:2-oxoglutarate ferredoxin oxidoreductase subunit gamma
VDYPFVTEADVLAVLFPEAYTKFRPMLKPGGILIADSGLVKIADDEENACRIPAMQIADDLGNRLARNVVILGCLIGMTGVVSRDAAASAIKATMKEKIVDLNIRALDAGIEFAKSGQSS